MKAELEVREGILLRSKHTPATAIVDHNHDGSITVRMGNRRIGLRINETGGVEILTPDERIIVDEIKCLEGQDPAYGKFVLVQKV
ncbi:MAG: hypothetical protein WAW92_03615 [Minisyncoccia bacterium]